MKKLILIFCLLMAFSCGDGGQVPEHKFIQIYKEVLIARESTQDREAGTQKVMAIFAKHNISEPEFRKMYMKLSEENPKKLAEMIDSIRHQTEIEIRQIDSTRKVSEMEKDTNTTAKTKK
jgi:hypothetical protein